MVEEPGRGQNSEIEIKINLKIKKGGLLPNHLLITNLPNNLITLNLT